MPPVFVMNARIIKTKIKTFPIEFCGKTYELSANMAVLADLEEEFGGINGVLESLGKIKRFAKVLRCFLSDAGCEFSEREILKNLDMESLNEMSGVVIDCLKDAGLVADGADEAEEINDPAIPDDFEEEEKN